MMQFIAWLGDKLIPISSRMVEYWMRNLRVPHSCHFVVKRAPAILLIQNCSRSRDHVSTLSCKFFCLSLSVVPIGIVCKWPTHDAPFLTHTIHRHFLTVSISGFQPKGNKMNYSSKDRHHWRTDSKIDQEVYDNNLLVNIIWWPNITKKSSVADPNSTTVSAHKHLRVHVRVRRQHHCRCTG